MNNTRPVSDPFAAQPAQPLPRWGIWGWTIVVALGLGVVLATVPMLRKQMDERLYAKFRNLPQAKFLPEGQQHPLRAACDAYNLKQYTKALPLFDNNTDTVFVIEKQFFSALCLLELNKMPKAEQRLQPIAQGQHPLRQEALWYTALSHIRRHDRKGGLRLLHQEQWGTGRISQEMVEQLRGKL